MVTAPALPTFAIVGCGSIAPTHAKAIAAQCASGRKLAVISQHRFAPSSQRVRRVIDRGELGRLVLAEARIPWYRTQEYYDSGPWRGTWALDGGGCLMNQGVHTVDLLLWLAGPVKTVYAQMRTAAHERIEVEDLVTATLTFANGAIGSLMATTSSCPGFPAYLGLHGTNGSAAIEGDELHLLAIKGRDTIHGKTATAHAIPEAHAAPGSWAWGDAHRAQFTDFIHAVRTNGTPLVAGVAGRAAVALINAVYDSARTGCVVTLAD